MVAWLYGQKQWNPSLKGRGWIMKITKFEDLNCWKEARKLRKMVSKVFGKAVLRKNYTLCDQIKSAALSIMANIAEGFESGTSKENVAFLTYARRSCGELRSHLYAAIDDMLIKENDFDLIYSQAISTGKLITSFINYLRRYDAHKRSAKKRSSYLTI
jgi:four helix bundle protein